MAASEDSVVSKLQWYQSTTVATVSFILAEQYRGKVKALFEKDCCKLLAEDEPIWQLELQHSIDPKKCKLLPGKRSELKLRKVAQEQWEEWGAKPEKQRQSNTPSNKKLPSSATTTTAKKQEPVTAKKQDLTPKAAKQDTTAKKDSTGKRQEAAPAKKQDISSTAATEKQKATSEKKKERQEAVTRQDLNSGSVAANSSTLESQVDKRNVLITELTPSPPSSPPPQDVVLVTHLIHDIVEKENHSVVVVKINIPGLDEAASSVTMSTHCVDLVFSSSDKQFLSSHQASPSTVFKWKIQLYDSVLPQRSTHFFTSRGVQLALLKTSTRPWRSLESLSHSPSDQPADSSSQETTTANPSQSTTEQETEDTSLPQTASMPITDQSEESINRHSSPTPSATSIFSNLQFPFITSAAPTPLKTVAAPSSSTTDTSSRRPSSPLSLTIVNSNRDSESPVNSGDTALAGGKMNDLDTSFNPFNLLPSSSSATEKDGIKKVLIEELNGEEKSDESDDERYSTPLHDLPGEKAQDSHSESSNSSPEPLPPLPKPKFLRLSPDLFNGPSLTGLANLGNTCFMSSIVQCLSNTVEVRDMFISQKYKTELNTTNPLGSKGLLAECFHTVIDKLWDGERQYLYPRKLKRMISSMSDRFSDYSQQDCHEFATFLLDALHEEFNRVKDKPLTEQVSTDGRPDDRVARESWLTYKKRNDSFIVDLFGGQFKSTLVCSVCSKVSVTFDPFMSLSVPLPHKMRTMSVLFVPQNPDHEPQEVILSLLPKASIELLKASVGKKVGVSMTELEVFKIDKSKLLTFPKYYSVSAISDSDFIVVSETLSTREAKGSVKKVFVLQRVKYPLSPTRCSGCGRSAAVGKELKRCSKCSAVAYCNRSCQLKDWGVHMHHCHPGRTTLIAMPFVISLPSREFTYSNVMSYAERFAKWFVTYTRSESQSSQSGSRSARPLFDLVPVDGYGSNLLYQPPLCDEGMNVLSLPSHYLAIDWHNNPKESDHVDITVKDMTLYKKATLDDNSSGVGKSTTLRKCLQLFTEPETLPKENAWYCPQCKEHREATKQMSVWHLPPILIVHLKRFSFDTTCTYRDKIDLLVRFPISGLDMSPYLGDQIDEDDPPIYDLYAIANHYGNDHLGHYLAVVRPPRGYEDGYWMYYDDDRVLKIQESDIVTENAYVLFYRRRGFETEDSHL